MSYVSRRPAYARPNVLFLPNNAGSVQAYSVATTTTATSRNFFYAFGAPYDTGLVSISAWCASGTTQTYDFALYDATGTRLGSLGATSINSTTGLKTWSPATPISMQAYSVYYAAFNSSSTTPTWVMNGPSAASRYSHSTFYAGASSSSLPTSITLNTLLRVTDASSTQPFLKLTFSA